MPQETFDINSLSAEIVEIIVSDPQINKKALFDKIGSCLQRRFDKELVPRNYNRYVTQKKKKVWLNEIKKQHHEIWFWREIIKKIDSANMLLYYDNLSWSEYEKGFRLPPKTGSAILCFYCERKMDAGWFGGEIGRHCTLDHVIPKSKGGKNNHENLVNSCNECNLLKADLKVEQFIRMLEQRIENKVVEDEIQRDLYQTIINNARKLL